MSRSLWLTFALFAGICFSVAIRRVLITGATGYVGGQLFLKLMESGHEVTCMVRDASRVSLSLGGARVVEADVSPPPAVCLRHCGKST